ncbi:MAG: flagellar biosynthesis protein FlhB [Gammaproteobacteria bacterium]|nr:flagellar biosynthesis protein FlhB [Gammaproteobacteria bacterium]
MAEQEDSQEKTEEPTPRQLLKAREKGQVARSKELDTTGVLMAGAAMLFLAGGGIVEGLADVMSGGLALERADTRDVSRLGVYLGASVRVAIEVMAPLMLAVLVAALLLPSMLGGIAFSLDPLSWKWSKMDPAKGLARMFGPKGLMELVKALAKFVVVLVVAVALLWSEVWEFMALGQLDDKAAMADAVGLIGWNLLVLSAAMIIIAAVDVPFQIWNHNRELRMTKQQVKDENKDTEGKPEIKQKIRQLQLEAATRRMMGEVPKADVIVTNPTHYAVALRYDAERMAAPRLVAKGQDLMAMRIREVAVEHGIPLVSAPSLARAIYHTTELEQEIPARLYKAVAQVLAYVFQLRRYRKQGGPPPAPLNPADLPLPDDNSGGRGGARGRRD